MQDDEVLAGLDTIDFPALTGDQRSETIPWLLSALAVNAGTLADSERIGGALAEELGRAELAQGPAAPVASVFLARLATSHPADHVQVVALRLFQDLELTGATDTEREMLEISALHAYRKMRHAAPAADLSGALGIAFAVDGDSPRLHKELRRLATRTRSEETHEAIQTIRRICSAA